MHFNQFAWVGELQNCMPYEQRPHQEQRNRCKTGEKEGILLTLLRLFLRHLVFAQSAGDTDICARNLGSKGSELLVEAVGEWCSDLLKFSMCLC